MSLVRTTSSAAALLTACALLGARSAGAASPAPAFAVGWQGTGCAAAVSPPATLRVGLVLDGGLENPFNAIMYRGLRSAASLPGVVGRALVMGPKEEGLATLSYLARRGFDLLVMPAGLYTAALDAAALRFPHVCFLSLDGPLSMFPHQPPNVRGTLYRTEQAAYLAGYLGVLVAKQRPGRPVVSTVAGAAIPLVDRFVAGFRAGARRADPRVRLLNGYAGDFADPAKCRALALHQIAAGSRVVFQVAGTCGLGALQAAKEKHVWGIGVDSDQSDLGPHVLTSVLKNMDVELVREVRSLRQGTFTAGTTAVLTLANGGVGLGRFSPLIPRPLLAKVEQLRRELIAGRIRVPATLDEMG